MYTLSKDSNNKFNAKLSCLSIKSVFFNYDLLFLNMTRAVFYDWTRRANFFLWMRSIARFNGKDNKVQVHKKHFTVILSFAINLPFRRVESRRFFRRALVSFAFFFPLGSIRVHYRDRSISLFSSVLTC